MVLCNYCRLSLECRPPDACVNHHKRVKDLEASSYQCQLCRLILAGLNGAAGSLGMRGANGEDFRYISLVSKLSRGGGRRRRIMFNARSWTGEVMRSVQSLTPEGRLLLSFSHLALLSLIHATHDSFVAVFL